MEPAASSNRQDPAGQIPAPIERVDPVTYVPTPIMVLTPPDPAGVNAIIPNQRIDDERECVYSYGRGLSKLFVITGGK